MTFKEAVNSLQSDYVVVILDGAPDTAEPLLAGGLDIIKEIAECSYTNIIVNSINIDDDIAIIKFVYKDIVK